MKNGLRGVLWLVWLASTSWLWHEGAIETGAAMVAYLLSGLVFLRPGTSGRRRRSALQYVEVGKEPVGSL